MSVTAPFLIEEANRDQALARVAFEGPAGAGKTYDALLWAYTLAGGDSTQICVIDTENKSASLYAPDFQRLYGGPRFNTIKFNYDAAGRKIERPYTPERLMAALEYVQNQGYKVVVIDTLSKFWNGPGGILEILDRVAQKYRGNSFAAWKDVDPIYRDLVEAIQGCGMHVIATMRVKSDWEVEEDEKGKKTPKKVGLKTEQREGFDYELDLVIRLDAVDHSGTITKGRVIRFADIGTIRKERMAELGRAFAEWLLEAEPRGSSSASPPPPAPPPALTVVPDPPVQSAPAIPPSAPVAPSAPNPEPPVTVATEPEHPVAAVAVAPDPALTTPSPSESESQPAPAADARAATSGVAPTPPRTDGAPEGRKPVDVRCPNCKRKGALFPRPNPPAGKEFFCARSMTAEDGQRGCNTSFSAEEVEAERAAMEAERGTAAPAAATTAATTAAAAQEPTVNGAAPPAAAQELTPQQGRELALRANALPAASRPKPKTFQAWRALGFEATDVILRLLEGMPADRLPAAAAIDAAWKQGFDALIAFLSAAAQGEASGPEEGSAGSE